MSLLKHKELEATGWRIGSAADFLGRSEQEAAAVENAVEPPTTHPLLDLSRDEIVPYFMWDYRYTVGQIKQILAEGEEARKIWLMAKILRDARYTDVWKFITLKKFLEYRERLLPRLGREKKFWEFMYSQWIKHGIVKSASPSNACAE